MSSDLQLAVQLQLLNNDLSVATVAVVVYDYILTLPSEVNYIWSKPWTWVSMLFLIVRYVGIYTALYDALFGSTFMPGPVKLGVNTVHLHPRQSGLIPSKGAGFLYSGDWASTAFVFASKWLMLLRVRVMWNGSRIVFSVLLLCYMVYLVLQVVYVAVFLNPNTHTTVAVGQVLDYSFCTEVLTLFGSYYKYVVIYPALFDLLLLVLALVPTTKQSIAMYRATKRWEPNRYMSLIVREGILYVFLNLVTNITTAIAVADENGIPPVWDLIFVVIAETTTIPIMPRFVLNMMELFDKDSRGHLEGGNSAFGISSHDGNVAGRDMSVSGISFAGIASRPGEGDGDGEIQLEPVGGNDERQGDSFA